MSRDSQGHCANLSSSSCLPETRLGSLLGQEDYLLKVLQWLLESDVQECRRVCKQWKRICDTAAVSLGQIPLEDIPAAAEIFPNAAAVTASRRVNIPTNLEALLSSFHNLIILGLTMADSLALSPVDWSNFTQLEELSLKLEFREDDSHFFSSIGELTRVTKLAVLRSHSAEPSLEPFTDLQSIQSLNVDNFFTNSEGEILFPSLTNLKHLELNGERLNNATRPQRIFQVRLPLDE